jgi:DNA helicase IV
MGAAAANKAAAAHLNRYAQAARELGAAADAVAVGRIDDEAGLPLYVGKALIRDDRHGVLVVNWQAPAASPYFAASPADPQGIRRKRVFTCTGNAIQDFTDVVFAEIGAAVEAGLDGMVDAQLLSELARGRDGSMRDIVATIQAAQYELIRAPRERVLVIAGGPGTGKTAVALHRVSWLLFHHRDTMRPQDVLVVGPHPTFMRYIGTVLPELGDADVELREVGRLAPDVPRGRSEPANVARIKGQARMAGLLRRALEARIGVPEPTERLLVGDRFVTVPGEALAEIVTEVRAANLPYAQRRQALRARLVQLLLRLTGVDAASDASLGHLIERLWPAQTPVGFLRDLLGSLPRLRAAGGEFTEDELVLLHRRGADRISQEIWSNADLPLLDEVDNLVNGPGRRYAHVVVDEAQDLSPMQLRAVGRRCASGSLTVVGDLAQSTGPWARDSWDEVTAYLPSVHPVAVRELRYGYRVPRQAYRFAARLLPVAAPTVTPPEVVRDGPAEPGIHQVPLAERAGRAVELAMARANDGQFVGIVCPPQCRREIEAALAANDVAWSSADRGELGAPVNLVGPEEAKGLEFDAVIVVEPEHIVTADPRGHRMLYVALTRTTRYLDVVCFGDPLPLTVPPVTEPPHLDPVEPFTARDGQRLAAHLAAQVRAAVPRQRQGEVLELVAEMLADRE